MKLENYQVKLFHLLQLEVITTIVSITIYIVLCQIQAQTKAENLPSRGRETMFLRSINDAALLRKLH